MKVAAITQVIFLCLTAAAFVAIGFAHFFRGDIFVRIVPPFFPAPKLLVQISGLCEIAGGIGLLIPPLRQPAAWGLIALLIAVFPANVYMAVAPQRFADLHVPTWVWWARLPLQIVLIADVWWVGL